MLRQILPRVTKPGRYVGGEVHAVRKDPSTVSLRVALAFPDVYEVAFSHLGLKILYHLLNARPDVWAERVYSPWPDMEREMRAFGQPLYGLESKDPLTVYDMIGITLQQELCATNVLQLLDLGGISLRADARTEAEPLIIGGGPLTANPEPLAAFFDAFVLGDGEIAIEQIADWLIEAKQRKLSRSERVEGLANIAGVYVPSLYNIAMDADRVVSITAKAGAPERVRKAIVPDLNAVSFIDEPLSPMVEPVHDRFAVEIQRGCSRGCRFCQAGVIYRPVRQRAPETVLTIARKGLATSGQETLGLLSLSASDYDHLTPLAAALFNDQAGRHISVQLPSLRVEGLTDELVEILNQERKTGFTLAPEAATERLRRVINKGNTEEDLFNALQTVFEKGWTHVKLYFMIGLPTETDDDIEAIIELAHSARLFGRRFDKRISLTVSVSTFVPKSQTPFQWATMIEASEIDRRQLRLKEGLRRVKVDFKWHHPNLSLLESAFARGDRRLADVIEHAYKAGCRFDAWTDQLDMAAWERAFTANGLNLYGYLGRSFDLEAPLPWSHLDFGASEAFLKSEWQAALSETLRPDCAYDRCFNCGVCDHKEVGRHVYARPDSPNAEKPHVRTVPAVSVERRPPPPVSALRVVRFQFSKRDYAVFLGHLDVMTQVSRAFKRARITVKHSEGFNPKPRIGFSPALPLGVMSSVEFFDAEIFDPAPVRALMDRLNRELPDGLNISDARQITKQTPSISESIAGFDYRFNFGQQLSAERIAECIARFEKAQSVHFAREQKKGTRHIDLKQFVPELKQDGPDAVCAHLLIIETRSIKPVELLEKVFGIAPESMSAIAIEKTGVRFAPPKTISPKDLELNGNQQKPSFKRNRGKELPNGSKAHHQCHSARDPGGIDRERHDSRAVHRKET
jgi:radical SAM family uncharacterized protein/radical SAM-linked protein